MGFLALYMGLFVFSSLCLSALGMDMVSSFGAVAACIGNIGPGFGTVGPVDNFAHIPILGKVDSHMVHAFGDGLKSIRCLFFLYLNFGKK